MFYHEKTGKLVLENSFQKVMRSLKNAKNQNFVIVFGYNENGQATFWKQIGSNAIKIKYAEEFIQDCDFSIANASEYIKNAGYAIDAKSLSLIQRGILK